MGAQTWMCLLILLTLVWLICPINVLFPGRYHVPFVAVGLGTISEKVVPRATCITPNSPDPAA